VLVRVQKKGRRNAASAGGARAREEGLWQTQTIELALRVGARASEGRLRRWRRALLRRTKRHRPPGGRRGSRWKSADQNYVNGMRRTVRDAMNGLQDSGLFESQPTPCRARRRHTTGAFLWRPLEHRLVAGSRFRTGRYFRRPPARMIPQPQASKPPPPATVEVTTWDEGEPTVFMLALDERGERWAGTGPVPAHLETTRTSGNLEVWLVATFTWMHDGPSPNLGKIKVIGWWPDRYYILTPQGANTHCVGRGTSIIVRVPTRILT
jgi:hypothetical protein